MGDISRILDATMCMLWISTYALLLIGTIKYKFPLISLDAQAMIAPFEIAVVIFFFTVDAAFNYAIAAYMIWALLELLIIVVIIKLGFLRKKYVPVYLTFCALLTIQMVYLVAHKDEMFRYSYVNTFIGMVFWFTHILRKDCPMKPLTLAAFLTKFTADILGAIVYYGDGDWFVNAISILLPVLDAAFVIVFGIRLLQEKKKMQTMDMTTVT